MYDFSFPKEAGSPNPHLWTNPIYALRYAEIVRENLVRRDSANADYYNKNYDVFKVRIEALDKAIQDTINSIPEQNRRLLTYHDSFAYFAARYGVTILGAIQPSDFSEPSARDVANLITQIKVEDVPAIFGSEVFPSPILEQIAKESGAKYVSDLRDDDLPGAPGDAKHSYLGLMAEDLRVMAEALGGDLGRPVRRRRWCRGGILWPQSLDPALPGGSGAEVWMPNSLRCDDPNARWTLPSGDRRAPEVSGNGK